MSYKGSSSVVPQEVENISISRTLQAGKALKVGGRSEERLNRGKKRKLCILKEHFEPDFRHYDRAQ